MHSNHSRIVFFRDDDVNALDDTFVRFVEIFTAHDVPLVLAVEPANLSREMVRFLLDAQSSYPGMIEIIQHGWSHAVHDLGEFGGKRGYQEQFEDICRGIDVMQTSFCEAFFPAFSFPFGHYNDHTVQILSDLNYLVLSSKFNPRSTAQWFYRFGRLTRQKWLFDHRISYHLGRYPGSSLEEISVSLSPIKRYLGPYPSTECVFESIEALKSQYTNHMKKTQVVGVVLHHRYHSSPDHMLLLAQFVEWLTALDGVRFMTLKSIYQVLHPSPKTKELLEPL